MRPMRYQPQGRIRFNRRAFPYSGFGYMPGVSGADIFGEAGQLTYFGGAGGIGNEQGLGFRSSATGTKYTTMPLVSANLDLAKPFTVVSAFVVRTLGTQRIAHYHDANNNIAFQLLTYQNRVSVTHGAPGTQSAKVTSSSIVANTPYVAVYQFDGTNHRLWLNGVEQNYTPGTGIANNSTNIRMLGRSSSGAYFEGEIALYAQINGLPDGQSLSNNPWQLFMAPDAYAEPAAAPGEGGGSPTTTTLAPAAGSAIASGPAPTITRSAHLTLAPAAGSATVTGPAPTITTGANVTLAPAVASITATGAAPSIDRSAHVTLAPAAGAAVASGPAPTLTQAAGATLNPAPASTIATGPAPIIGQTAHYLMQPAPGSASIAGLAPDVTRTGTPQDPRYARPDTVLSAGNWTASSGTDLAAMLAEPSADSDTYIQATAPGSCEIASNPVQDPGTSAGQVLRYQAWSPTGDGVIVRLKQGAAVIASWTHAELPLAPTIYARELSAQQCDAITDYAALSFVFEAIAKAA